ncbi:hypothetical protein F8388_022495 [Cannabis sativa]|uniref:EF-hand domain-containing protein n=1 Tax=Cannabis sativa TaxID=3483 RepID=A0A7J6EWU1_CANSA|nr:hypothetical protein F8388_022495 [Cannabis sativa]
MAADVASYHNGDGSGKDPSDPTRDPNQCESSESIALKKKGSGIEVTSEERSGKDIISLPNVDHIQRLRKLLGGRILKRKSSSRYTRYTHARTLQSPDKVQRLEGLIIRLQKLVQHISQKVQTKEHLAKDNKIEELIQKTLDMHSTRPSQPQMPQPLARHSDMHGPLTSQYQWQIPQPPPLQQPLPMPYHYPHTNGPSPQQHPPPYYYAHTYRLPLQQPMPPYHYPNTNGLPLQQPTPPNHYPNTNGLPLQQPTPPYDYPNTNGLPLQQPTPPYHYPNTNGLPLQQPTPPYDYPNTNGLPLQQPMPPYHYPNTNGLPLQQPMPPYHYPNTNGLPLQQPMPPYHYPNTNGLPLQQPMPPYHYPNTYGLPLQQPTPPYHYPNTNVLPLQQPTPNTNVLPLQQPTPNTNVLPLQQPTPPYHNPNTNGAPSHQPKPPDHHPSMYGPLSQQPPIPKVSTGPDPKPCPSLVPDNTKDACPKREHTTQDILGNVLTTTLLNADHPESQAGKKARNVFLGFNIWEKLKEFSKMNRLKRRAFFEISVYMVENDACLKAFFNRMDVSSRGMINMDELIAGFKLSLPCPSVDLLMKIVRILGNENKHIRAAFEVFDENQSGYIEMDDLRHCFDDGINVEENIEEVVEAIMEDVDIDKVDEILYGLEKSIETVLKRVVQHSQFEMLKDMISLQLNNDEIPLPESRLYRQSLPLPRQSYSGN